MSSQRKREFGDFQTPLPLARQVCNTLLRYIDAPRTIVEPNCGHGNFLIAAAESFATADEFIGVEINPEYAQRATKSIADASPGSKNRIRVQDFFTVDWANVLEACGEPFLILGNPPWVTNSTLGTLGSDNLPLKSNFQFHRGIDAITGKANFDISEWMLIHAMTWIEKREGTIAMLCKTSTARRVLKFWWERGYRIQNASIRSIDAKEHFSAAVDACLLIVSSSKSGGQQECAAYRDLRAEVPSFRFGLCDGHLVSNLADYHRWRHCFGESQLKWRSGIKHDCTRVMELRECDGQLVNGFGEAVELEEHCLFPMFKGSQLAAGDLGPPHRWMIVPQRAVSEDTTALREIAPRTWEYLMSHVGVLDRRASTIYRGRPRFAVFGVGEYTFRDWKVAVCALYKRPRFVAIGPFRQKPAVLDDTSYFLPCASSAQAEAVAALLNSTAANSALSSRIFLDAKRPLTIDVLNQLNLSAIANELDLGNEELNQLPLKQTSPQTVLF